MKPERLLTSPKLSHCSPAAGFTLLEVLAVVLLTSLVLGVALDYYLDLSWASQRATNRTRDVRRAAAILDRIAVDLEGASIVQKPSGDDRLSHPWIFLGENRFAERGSDRIKFITRNHTPRGRSESRHESDVAVVTYDIEAGDDERLSLRRWLSPQLPEGLDRDFPDPEEMLLLSEDLESFSLRFLDESGKWVEHWDSSQISQADELPVAVRIELAMANLEMESALLRDSEDLEGNHRFRRTVVLPVRPLDLKTLTDPQGPYGTGLNQDSTDEEAEKREADEEGEDSEGDSVSGNKTEEEAEESPFGNLTVADCVVVSEDSDVSYFYLNYPNKLMSSFSPGWFESSEADGVYLQPHCRL